jgi:uncharacterized membrane protein YhaH (DUF805 family)
MNTYLQVLQKYAVFGGRAPRNEYWMFFLFNILIAMGIGLFCGVLKGLAHVDLTFLIHLYSLALLCPGLAVGIRRLHDTNRSGWWMLLSGIPLIGSIILLVFMCQDSTPADNNFGPNPKAVTMNVW